MRSEILYILIFLVSVLISSISQIVLKKSAGKSYDNKLREYFNVPVIIAYTLFFVSSLLTVLAYKGVPLSMGPILEATGYVWVSILGAMFLKEKLGKGKIIGMAIIIAGIVIFNIG